MKNEATMIFMCKWVKNDEAIQGFKILTSQEWS